MGRNVTTISMPVEVKKRGQRAAQKMFGSDRKLSAYLQYLINQDCDKKKIK